MERVQSNIHMAKKLRILLAGLGILFWTGGGLYSQESATVKKRLPLLQERLALTEKQSEQVAELLAHTEQERQNAESHKKGKIAFYKELAQINDEFNREMELILDDSQKKEYEKIKQKRRETFLKRKRGD